ncbi:MAG: right-handed parallel beta-helix repeat-containing protein, partial [Candidatus Eisenbacteria bacterium]|nr:right-handed parallel beta-helix repeat-containing protein [Candidatus Eisenbacteria bacterium]
MRRGPASFRPATAEEYGRWVRGGHLKSGGTEIELGPRIEDCTIVNVTGTGVLVVGQGPGPIVAGCLFEGNTGRAVDLDSWTFGVRISGCEFRSCGTGVRLAAYADGVQVPCELTDCNAHDNLGPGLLIDANPEGWTQALVTGSRFERNAGPGIRSYHGLALENVDLVGNEAEGLVVRGSGAGYDLTVRGGRIAENGGDGIATVQSGRFEVEDARIVANAGWGLAVDDGLVGESVLRRAVVAANEAGGVSILEQPSGASLSILETTISGNTGPGIRHEAPAGGLAARMERTIIAENSVALRLGRSSPFIEVTCTDIHGNDGGNWIPQLSSFYEVGGNFSADPRFCDAPLGDWSLREDSPCAPGNHPDGVECGLIGALPVGCPSSLAAGEPPASPGIGVSLQPSVPNPFRGTTAIACLLYTS